MKPFHELSADSGSPVSGGPDLSPRDLLCVADVSSWHLLQSAPTVCHPVSPVLLSCRRVLLFSTPWLPVKVNEKDKGGVRKPESETERQQDNTGNRQTKNGRKREKRRCVRRKRLKKKKEKKKNGWQRNKKGKVESAGARDEDVTEWHWRKRRKEKKKVGSKVRGENMTVWQEKGGERERKREGGRDRKDLRQRPGVCVCVCVRLCMCECVCVRRGGLWGMRKSLLCGKSGHFFF